MAGTACASGMNLTAFLCQNRFLEVALLSNALETTSQGVAKNGKYRFLGVTIRGKVNSPLYLEMASSRLLSSPKRSIRCDIRFLVPVRVRREGWG